MYIPLSRLNIICLDEVEWCHFGHRLNRYPLLSVDSRVKTICQGQDVGVRFWVRVLGECCLFDLRQELQKSNFAIEEQSEYFRLDWLRSEEG